MSRLRINTSLAEPGMVVAEDIYSFSDQLIIGSGTILTDGIITRLKFYSIPDFVICEADTSPEAADIDFRSISSETFQNGPTHIAKVKRSAGFRRFSKAFTSSLLSCKDQLNGLLEHQDVLPDTTAMIQEVSTLFASW